MVMMIMKIEDPKSRCNFRLNELFDKMMPEFTVSTTKILSLYLVVVVVISVQCCTLVCLEIDLSPVYLKAFQV